MQNNKEEFIESTKHNTYQPALEFKKNLISIFKENKKII